MALPGLAAATPVPTSDLQRLRAHSAALTGFEVSELPEDFAAALWAAFAETGRLAELRAWLAEAEPDRSEAPSPLAVEIATAWYAGVLPASDGARVGTFYGALAWQAASFANPPGRCAIAGSWASPPQPA